MTDVFEQMIGAAGRVGKALSGQTRHSPLAGEVLADPRLWLAGEPRLDAVAAADDALHGGALAKTVSRLAPQERQRVAAAATLAGPVEVMLALGGDDRAVPVGGRNSYGMPLADAAPVLRASSCTATPPDGDALAAALRWRDRRLTEVRSTETVDVSTVRADLVTRLSDLLGLGDGWSDRLILSPSGTDVESLLTVLSAGTGREQVRVVTVGAREAGSGTVLAAGLRSFRGTTPYAVGLTAGEPLAGGDPEAVEVVDVDLRDARGRVRRSSDVQAEVEAHVEWAVEQGARPLVHVMAGSKTGLIRLDPAWVRSWTSRVPQLRVVVDAAQLRLPRQQLADYLRAGSSAFVTGSKALGGPPFCGALLPAADLWADAVALADDGSGLHPQLVHSVSAADLPPRLRALTRGLEPVNLGLLARWEVALTEWERLAALGSPLRREVTGSLVAGWRRGVGDLAGVQVAPERSDTVTTIVSFLVAGQDGWMDKGELGEIYARVTAAPGVYLGQPVEIVAGRSGVLRLAVGAPTVTRLVARAEELGGLTEAVQECVGVAVDRIAGALPATVHR
ncbi:hypothetical protein BH23ACT6_BH23ACT6_22850 [soil metagenome]